MTPEQHQRATDLFVEVCELPPEQRGEFLRESCSDDPEVLAEVESLLTEDATSEGFLDRPALGSAIGLDIDELADGGESTDPLVGRRVGRYEVTQLLATGGMGAVYLAQQDSPRRTVALKVMKQGMTSPAMVRRFEQEVQVLGRLQHPGIAQIFDAGTYDQGRARQPYFAMEYVDGMPLLDYADANDLTRRQRMELLIRVCDAVHHAHQKGVVHRDLKPSNILVTQPSEATTLVSTTSHDLSSAGVGQPKILDFGVARSTGHDIQSTTLQTNIGQLIGTVSYMSPEQAAGNPALIDARSDVYALGVLMYELLAGRLPYELRNRMIHEAVRVIREDEPTALSQFDRSYRGDLETIALKALEKDKTRRYQSAAELAADLQHYLSDEPIAARPPSRWYQFQKYASRNRAVVVGVAAVFVTLVIGFMVALKFGIDASRNAERFERERDAVLEQVDFLYDLFAMPELSAMEIRSYTVPELLDRADARLSGDRYGPRVEGDLRQFLGRTFREVADYQRAALQLEQAKRYALEAYGPEAHQTLVTVHELATAYRELGRLDEAETELTQALDTKRRIGLEKSAPADVLTTRHELALVMQLQGRTEEALAEATIIIDERRKLLAALERRLETAAESEKRALSEEVRLAREALLSTQHNLAYMHFQRGDFDAAVELCRETLDSRADLLSDNNPETLHTRHLLGVMLSTRAETREEGVTHLQAALAGRREKLGSPHPDTVLTLKQLGAARTSQGEFALALPYLNEALEYEEARSTRDYATLVDIHKRLAALYRKLGENLDDALAHLQTASALLDEHLPEDRRERMETRGSYARALHEFHRYEEAAPIFQRVVDEARTVYEGDDRWKIGFYLALLGSTQKQLGDTQAALASLEEAAGLAAGSRFEGAVTKALSDLQAELAEEPVSGL